MGDNQESFFKDNVCKHLQDMFKNILDPSIIQDIIQSRNYDFDSSLDDLMILANSSNNTQITNSLDLPQTAADKTSSEDESSGENEDQGRSPVVKQACNLSSGKDENESRLSERLNTSQTPPNNVNKNDDSNVCEYLSAMGLNVINTNSKHKFSKHVEQKTFDYEAFLRKYQFIKNETNVLNRVDKLIKEDVKIMVILRGCPGSGKSHLAKEVVKKFSSDPRKFREYIFSSDDYFMCRGEYVFNPENLGQAHMWNQKRVLDSINQNVSPIIIDNTNTQAWEMKPYVVLAVENGYDLEILEPDTYWKFNVNKLFKLNIHSVPKQAIQRMVERYELNLDSKSLLIIFGLTYSCSKKPPQLASSQKPINSPRKRGGRGRRRNKALVFEVKDGFEGLPEISPPDILTNIDSNTGISNKTNILDSPVQNHFKSELNTSCLSNLNKISSKNINGTIDFQETKKEVYNSISESLHGTESPTFQPINFKFDKKLGLGEPINFELEEAHGVDIPSNLKLDEACGPDISVSFKINKEHEQLNQMDHSLFATLINHFKIQSIQSDTVTICTANKLDEAVSNFWENKDLICNAPNSESNIGLNDTTPILNITSNGNTYKKEVIEEHNYNIKKAIGGTEIKSYEVDPTKNDSSDHLNGTFKSVFYDGSNSNSPNILEDDMIFKNRENKRTAFNKLVCNRADNVDQPTASYSNINNDYEEPSISTQSNTVTETTFNKDCNIETSTEIQLDAGSKRTEPKQIEDQNNSKLAIQTVSLDGVELLNDLGSKNQEKYKVLPVVDLIALLSMKKAECSSNHDVTKITKINMDGLSPKPENQIRTSDVCDILHCDIVESQGLDTVKDTQTSKPYCKITGGLDDSNKINSSTNTSYQELSELDYSNYKILFGKNRNICENIKPDPVKNATSILLLHKGTMTSDNTNEAELNLEVLTNAFPHIGGTLLNELVETCNGDINWAGDLLLDSNQVYLPINQSKTNKSIYPSLKVTEEYKESIISHMPKNNGARKKNVRVESKTSKESTDLKDFIEKNIGFNESHYSDHVLKIIKKRRELQNCDKPDDTKRDEKNIEEDWKFAAEKTMDENNVIQDDETEKENVDFVQLTVSKDFVVQLEQNLDYPFASDMIGDSCVIDLPKNFAFQLFDCITLSLQKEIERQQQILEEMKMQDEEFARQLQEQEDIKEDSASNSTASLDEIMDLEYALNLIKSEQLKDKRTQKKENAVSTVLSRQLLVEKFPNVDKGVLMELFHSNDYSLDKTVALLNFYTYEDNPFNLAHKEKEVLGEIKEFVKQEPERRLSAMKPHEESMFTAQEYRERASHYRKLHTDYMIKAQNALGKYKNLYAYAYFELARECKQLFENENHKAASVLFDTGENSLTLDLHMYTAKEAMERLDVFLDKHIARLKKPREKLQIITGRGLHSAGGLSVIRPKVIQRLSQRNIGYRIPDINPGVIYAKINRNTKLTSHL